MSDIEDATNTCSYQNNNQHNGCSQGVISLTQYGNHSYGLNPAAGGIRGANTKKTLDRKKKSVTAWYDRKGGSQSYFRRGVCSSMSPAETNMLIKDSGYEDTEKYMLGRRK